MNKFEITGELHEKFDEQIISDRFKKRDFVLKIVDGNYEQHLKMQLTQDRVDLIDNYRIGEELTVSFNLKGRPYEKNGETIYFTNIEAWKVQRPNEQQASPQNREPMPTANDMPPAPPQTNNNNDGDEMGDDLPF